MMALLIIWTMKRGSSLRKQQKTTAAPGRRVERIQGSGQDLPLHIHTPAGASRSCQQICSPRVLDLGMAVEPPHAAHMRIARQDADAHAAAGAKLLQQVDELQPLLCSSLAAEQGWPRD